MNTDVVLKKSMTKKAYKELQKSRRAVNGFNIGTRTMKTVKKLSRQMRKREEMNLYEYC